MASASDGVRVQTEEFGQNTIASVSQLDKFQPVQQTALLLVEQAVLHSVHPGPADEIHRQPNSNVPSVHT